MTIEKMKFKEANQLAKEVFNNKKATGDEVNEVYKAFMEGQPQRFCSLCAHEKECAFQHNSTNIGGCNFFRENW